MAEYYIEPKLKKFLDNIVIPALKKEDKDFVMVIDGAEGSGKSTFALQIGKYVDETLNLDRVCFDGDIFKKSIMDSKFNNCVIFDEAFTGLSSRSALSEVNRTIVSMMMQMRQKNLFVIIVLPSIFLLDKYVALWRCKFFFHVYEIRGIRGYFRGYNRNQTKAICMLGKKTYSYMPKVIKTKKKGRFYGKFALGDDSVKKEYTDKKMKAFERISEETSISSRDYSLDAKKNLMDLYYEKKKQNPQLQRQEFCDFVNKGRKKQLSPERLSQIKKEIREIEEKDKE